MSCLQSRATVLFILIVLSLPSCTVAYYETRNALSGSGAPAHRQECDIKYSVVVASESHTSTYGVRKTDEHQFAKLRSKYTESTKMVLSRGTCRPTFVEDEDEADFKVRVERSLGVSALPQEWLTGLSFGLIPSWGTRPSQYAYTVEDRRAKRRHRYVVDEKFYSHLVLFPVFWLMFFTLDEFAVYERALVNFIDGN